MKKLVICLLSTMMSGSLVLPFTATQASPALKLAANNVSSGTVVTQGNTRLRYYPNHQISAAVYNKDVLKDMLALSQRLGWDTIYIQGLPSGLRGYAKQYFSENNIDLNDLSDDAYVSSDSQDDLDTDDDDSNDNVYIGNGYGDNNYIPDGASTFFYGYAGNGYYDNWGYPNYNGRFGHGGRYHGGGYPGYRPHGGGYHGGGGGGFGSGDGGHHGGGFGGGGGGHGGGGRR